MKSKSSARIMAYALMLAFFSVTSVFAQTEDTNADMSQDNELQQMANDDLAQRYPGTQDLDVTWEKGMDNYSTAFYNMEDTEYMTRYDDKSMWVETYSRTEWDENVPTSIRNNFDENYQDMTVESYWTVVDAQDNANTQSLIFFRGEDGSSKSVIVSPEGDLTPTENYTLPKDENETM